MLHVLVDVEPVDDGVELEQDVELVAPFSNATKNRQLVNAVLKEILLFILLVFIVFEGFANL